MANNTRRTKSKDDDKSDTSTESTSTILNEVLNSDTFKVFLSNLIQENVEIVNSKLLNEINEVKQLNLKLLDEVSSLKQELSNAKLQNIVFQSNTAGVMDSNNKPNIKVSKRSTYANISAGKAGPSLRMDENKKQSREDNECIRSESETNSIESYKRCDLPQENEDGFTKITYKKNKSKFIKGNGPSDTNLQFAESKIYIFLGRCGQSTTEQCINEYLEKKYEGETFTIEDLQSKGQYKSFKISANPKLMEQMYDSANWPNGALVKRYIFRRKPIATFAT